MPGTPDDRRGGTTDADVVVLQDTGADPVDVGATTLNAGVFKMRDALGVFNPRDGGALPLPREEGEVLIAATASAFVQGLPLATDDGFLVLSDFGRMVVKG